MISIICWPGKRSYLMINLVSCFKGIIRLRIMAIDAWGAGKLSSKTSSTAFGKLFLQLIVLSSLWIWTSWTESSLDSEWGTEVLFSNYLYNVSCFLLKNKNDIYIVIKNLIYLLIPTWICWIKDCKIFVSCPIKVMCKKSFSFDPEWRFEILEVRFELTDGIFYRRQTIIGSDANVFSSIKDT